MNLFLYSVYALHDLQRWAYFIVEFHFKFGNVICLKFPELKNLIYLSVQCIFK